MATPQLKRASRCTRARKPEEVNMIAASRSYQNNVEVMNTAKTLLLKTLQLGQ